MAKKIQKKHGAQCNNSDGEWSGSPNPENPANEWICDECGEVIAAVKEKRTKRQVSQILRYDSK